MGREAECVCRIGSGQAHTRVLLESTGIVLRGKLRRIIPLGSITELRVDGSKLLFQTGEDHVTLELGLVPAHQWLAAMQKAPKTLAQKLGITATTRVGVLGSIDCPELSEAVASGKPATAKTPQLIVAHVDSQSSLDSAVRMVLPFAKQGVAVWLVYTKGALTAVGETAVRKAAREVGMRDTKVVSVSSQLTALKFSLAK